MKGTWFTPERDSEIQRIYNETLIQATSPACPVPREEGETPVLLAEEL